MQIYNYNPETGEYVGAGQADPDPMDAENFLHPAFSTDTAPPAPGAKQVAKFSDGAWSIVADHRGETWFNADRHPVIIDQIGDPSDLDLVAVLPLMPTTKDQLNAYANTRQWATATGGRIVSIGSDQVLMATTEASMSQMAIKVLRLQQPDAPASIKWQIGPVEFVDIPAADFIAAAASAADFVQATFDALPEVFADIASGAITSIDQIDAIFFAI